MELRDPSLFRQAVPVGHKWIEASAADAMAVNDPATGEMIGNVPKLGAAETKSVRERLEHKEDLYHVCEVSSFAELSTIGLLQRRPGASDLRLALTPASQGHAAVVEPVSTAAAFSSVCYRGGLCFPRQTQGTRFSDKFTLRLVSQGGMAVVGLVPAAAMSCGPAARPARADKDINVPGRSAR